MRHSDMTSSRNTENAGSEKTNFDADWDEVLILMSPTLLVAKQ